MANSIKAVLTMILLTCSPFTHAFTGSQVREACMAYEKVVAGVADTTAKEDRDAFLCMGFVGGLTESQREKCVWSKINVKKGIEIEDYWGDAATFAQNGANSLENSVDLDSDLMVRELLIFLNEDPKRWDQRMFSMQSVFWMDFFKKYPEKKCKVLDMAKKPRKIR